MTTPSYAEAAAELEGILKELEGDRLDVDQVAAYVQQASVLIQICREKVTNAKLAVEKLGSDMKGDV